MSDQKHAAVGRWVEVTWRGAEVFTPRKPLTVRYFLLGVSKHSRDDYSVFFVVNLLAGDGTELWAEVTNWEEVMLWADDKIPSLTVYCDELLQGGTLRFADALNDARQPV